MRTVWVSDTDVAGRIEAGRVVTATRALSDWCLRGDDGSEPIPAGTALEVVETRGWGAAMVQELPALHVDGEAGEGPAVMAAMVELEQLGLWEFAPAEAAS
jgi:hypothetical protein